MIAFVSESTRLVLVGVRRDRTRNPWVGSQVFYLIMAKSSHEWVPRFYSFIYRSCFWFQAFTEIDLNETGASVLLIYL